MVKHLVLWKLKETAEGKSKAENAVVIKQCLEDLAGKIPGLLSIHVGINDPEAPVNNYDVVLEASFSGMAELNAYQVHPLHIAVATYIKKLNEARVGIDYQE